MKGASPDKAVNGYNGPQMPTTSCGFLRGAAGDSGRRRNRLNDVKGRYQSQKGRAVARPQDQLAICLSTEESEERSWGEGASSSSSELPGMCHQLLYPARLQYALTHSPSAFAEALPPLTVPLYGVSLCFWSFFHSSDKP